MTDQIPTLSAVDFVKAISFLPLIAEQNRKIITNQERLLNLLETDFVTIKDIARDVGRSNDWIRLNPWVLPGAPDIDGKPRKWLRTRWEEHRQHLDEHKCRWGAMNYRQRQKVIDALRGAA